MIELLHNHDSEQVIIGRVLVDPAAFEGFAAVLTPADFHSGPHAAVWRVMGDLVAAGEPVAYQLVKARLDEQGATALERALSASSMVGTDPHVREVRACALRRRQLAEVAELAEDIKAGRGTDRIGRITELEDGAHADDHYQDAVEFIYGERDNEAAVWGEGTDVLWAGGEPCYIVGPTGVGKTTLTQQLVAARLGLRSDVLGMPVEMHEQRILYLACDRPRQVRRAFRRLISPADAEAVRGELVLWEGPPPVDFATNPEGLYGMARHCGADTLIIDSVKDVVANLSDPNQAQAFNRAVQHCVANGVEVLGLHHTRKRVPGTKVGIDDVFGGWIAAGAGSVIMLQGEPGDMIVDFIHLKQPAEQVGPWKIEHDHVRGISKVTRTTADLRLVLANVPGGMTATALAGASEDGKKPTANEIARVARRAEKMVLSGTLVRLERDGQVRYAVAGAAQVTGDTP